MTMQTVGLAVEGKPTVRGQGVDTPALGGSDAVGLPVCSSDPQLRS
jgi:hypothetical protein